MSLSLYIYTYIKSSSELQFIFQLITLIICIIAVFSCTNQEQGPNMLCAIQIHRKLLPQTSINLKRQPRRRLKKVTRKKKAYIYLVLFLASKQKKLRKRNVHKRSKYIAYIIVLHICFIYCTHWLICIRFHKDKCPSTTPTCLST